MRKRLLKFLRHLGIIILGVAMVGWLLIWLIDVPNRWPDHGRLALAENLSPAQLEQVSCLIEEIEANPSQFRTTSDFNVTYDDKLLIEGWLFTTAVESQTGSELLLRAELRRRVETETSCSLSGILLPSIEG